MTHDPKKLTAVFDGIPLPNNLETASVVAHAARLQNQIFFGDLDRQTFSRSVFLEQDLAALPVGHLLDHRIRMPKALVHQLLHGPTAELAAVLRRMLCAAPHRQASELIAESLGLRPDEQATSLQNVGRENFEFAEACLSGRHDHALTISRAHATSEPIDTLAFMAVYYGALDNQLIAARQRAIADYRFDFANEPTDTVGGAQRDRDAFINALQKAAAGVSADSSPRGRRPDLINLSKPSAKAGWAILQDAGRYQDDDETRDQLRATLSELLEIAHELEGNYQSEISRRIASLDDRSGSRGVAEADGSRLRLGTVWAGQTGSCQLLYAAKRLCAFNAQIRDLVHEAIKAETVPFYHWLPTRLATSHEESSKVLLVNRSVVWRPTGVEQARTTSGNEADLRALLKRREGPYDWIGRDIWEKENRKFKKWARGRTPIADELAGSRLWDILPDYRFAITSASVNTVDPSYRDRTGHEFRPGQPSPRHRAPKKSHRPC